MTDRPPRRPMDISGPNAAALVREAAARGITGQTWRNDTLAAVLADAEAMRWALAHEATITTAKAGAFAFLTDSGEAGGRTIAEAVAALRLLAGAGRPA